MKKLDPSQLSLSVFLTAFLMLIIPQLAHAALPVPWLNQGIGGQVAGSANFANNQFTLNSAGIDIGGSFDTFHYIYQPYTGDVELIAKVESIGNTNISAKAGVMIRETLTTGSKNAFMSLTYGSTSLFQRRTSTNGGTTATSGATVPAPYWVKLVRQGNTFKAYVSANGTSWTQVGTSTSITMASNVYVGLAATSKDLTRLNTNVFSNVSVRPAVAPVAPVLNTATAGVAQVNLSWSASPTATSYKVKYGTVSGSYGPPISLGNVTSTSVTGLNNGIPYYFVVTAVNDYGESAKSNEKSATPLDPPTVFIKKIDYNAMGQKTRIEYGNGVITTNTYDPLNLRLKRIYSINASGQALQDLSYTYDSAGNILSITDALNTANQTFQYDALNRLTQASGTSYGTKNYQYDPIGNIVNKEGKIYSYAEGGAGVHAVTSVNDGSTITTMTYDPNGNMATKQKGTEITYFDYDIENRLIQIQKDLTSVPKASAKITAQYAYDGDGGRVKKTVGSTVTRYVGSLYEETNGIKTRHIFVGDMKVASITGAQQMYYLTDHLGGTNVVTDKVGVKKEIIEYEPYGGFSRRDKYGTGSEVANFYFTGQRFDEESGLYYYNSRYYDPALGRFISADSIVQSPGNGQTFNRYAYAGNNPVNNIDPSGHSFWKSFLVAFVGAVAAVVTAGISVGFTALATQGLAALSAGQAALAGAVGGAISGGLGAGLNGAGIGGILQGAAFGGLLGGVGGFAAGGGFGAASGWVVGGLLAGGIANAATTNGWADLAGGILGGITGTVVGMGGVKAFVGSPSAAESSSSSGMAEVIQETVDSNPSDFQGAIDAGRSAGGETGVGQAAQAISIVKIDARGSILRKMMSSAVLDVAGEVKGKVPYAGVGKVFGSAPGRGAFSGGAKGIAMRATNALGVTAKWAGKVLNTYEAFNYGKSSVKAFQSGNYAWGIHDAAKSFVYGVSNVAGSIPHPVGQAAGRLGTYIAEGIDAALY